MSQHQLLYIGIALIIWALGDCLNDPHISWGKVWAGAFLLGAGAAG